MRRVKKKSREIWEKKIFQEKNFERSERKLRRKFLCKQINWKFSVYWIGSSVKCIHRVLDLEKYRYPRVLIVCHKRTDDWLKWLSKFDIKALVQVTRDINHILIYILWVVRRGNWVRRWRVYRCGEIIINLNEQRKI